jgi:glutaredoxin
VRRRDFLSGAAGVGFAAGFGSSASPLDAFGLPAQAAAAPGFNLVDVTAQAGIHFQHNSGAYGGKLLPETLGSGCAFLDYDADGWQDILLVNAMDWPGHKQQRTTLRLYHNNRNGTFTDITKIAGLDIEIYGMGVAVGDYNNDGFPDIFITCVGQNRLFRNTGKGTFVDVTKAAGLAGRAAFSTSAIWFDYDRDGLLDLFVCNYVRWSPEHDVFCSLDATHKSYCTPEAYRGDTSWLFHNRGDGTFEDVTASSGIFDSSSKSLGVAMLDFDGDGWPDLLVANDTQPNKLYKNLGNGKFKDVAVEAGLAFSADGKARAGMGVDVGDFENSGRAGIAITNFDNEMIGLYRASRTGVYDDIATASGVGIATRNSLGFGCTFVDADLDGLLDLVVANGHIDETVRNIRGNVGYAQAPQLFLNSGNGKFHDIASEVGGGFDAPKVGRGLAYGDFDNDGDADLDGLLDLVVANGHIDETVRNIRGNVGYAQAPQLFLNSGNGKLHDIASEVGGGFDAPKVGRGLAYGDFDNDGDADLLLTTNHGPAYLYRNDQINGNRGLRLRLVGTKSNRDAVGASVHVTTEGITQSRVVRGGSSYLSQSELPLTFGVGKRDKVDRIVVNWPSGRTEEFKSVETGKSLQCIEGKGLTKN